MQAEKVVKLHNSPVPELIEKFLRKNNRRSEDTQKAYRKDLNDFFQITRGKSIEFLTEQDIQIKLEDFDEFIEEMLESEKYRYSNATINRKTSTVRSLLKYLKPRLKEYGIEIDISYFDEIESLPEHINHYSALSVDEALQMARLARDTERKLRFVKYYLILFALDTCIRQTAILQLKWSNFVERDDCVEIVGIDKGNKEFRKKIAKEFYQELLTIKQDNSDYVFNISRKAIHSMMQRLCKRMGFPDNRYIVFHSFRKAGITFAYRLTGDVLAAMKAGNHASFDTTKHYIEEQDYGAIGAYSVTKNLDLDIFKRVPNEKLLEAIYACKKDLQIILARKLQELYPEITANSQ